MSIADHLSALHMGIDAAIAQAGRAPDAVTLIAASKTHPIERIHEAQRAGQVHFGESYAQELRDKGPLAPELCWHFIGRLQRNKAKYVARHAQWVHSITHVDQALALASRASRSLRVLVNVNVGHEESKAGLTPAEVPDLIDALHRIDGIEPRGLMCLPPFTKDPEHAGPYFEQLAGLLVDARSRGHELTELSMGMSRDYAVAIRHGATWVRVGTAIFGERISG